MRPIPETIVSGWFLFGVGELLVVNCRPERAVMSSKRILPLLDLTWGDADATKATITAIVRNNRTIVRCQCSIIASTVRWLDICRFHRCFQPLELCALSRSIGVPAC